MSEWIDFILYRPSEEKSYIVTTKCGMVTTAMWFDKYRSFMNNDTDGWIEEKVTHWMPLPKPPKK